MKPTYVVVQLKGPSADNPGGHVIDGHFIIEGNTVVDVNGEAEKDVDGTTYSRKLTANPKVVARRLVRDKYARRKKLVSGFDGPIFCPKFNRA